MSEGLTPEDGAQLGEGVETPPAGYSFPEEFAERGWTKTAPQFANDAEANQWLVKQYDQNQNYVGGKWEGYAEENGYSKMPDVSSQEEVYSFLSKLAPEEASEYKLQELYKDEKYSMGDDASAYFGEVFKNNAVTTHQAKGILDSFKEFEVKQLESATNPEDYANRMTTLFGNDYNTAKQPIDSMLKELLSPEELGVINDKMPNEMVEMMYKISKGVHEKYGYEESSRGAASAEPQGMQMTADQKEAKWNELHQEILALSNRNHTEAEKQALIKKQMQYI